MIFVDVIIPLALPELYTYSLPENILSENIVGKRVIVQFGKKKLYTAIIKNVHNQKPNYETKQIDSIIDETPVVNKIQLDFWDWIAKYYMCAIGEVYTAALPVSFRIESQTQIYLTRTIFDENLSDKEQIIIEELKKNKTSTLASLSSILDIKNPMPLINKLISKGIVDIYEYLKSDYKPKYIKQIKLSEFILSEIELQSAFKSVQKVKKQTDILLSYCDLSKLNYSSNTFTYQEVTKKDLLEKSKATNQAINSLFEKNILVEYEKKVSRIDKISNDSVSINRLSSNQQLAYNQIVEKFKTQNTVLLFGVTSSGKTEIYIHIIRDYIKKDKQVLYLLPEIALTSQIINRLRVAFGDVVGIYHSKFSDSERYEIWNRTHEKTPKSERYQLILGVRSAIFLPFTNLGLIIIDEEHETTFKQYDPAPRYHARDSALVLAKLYKAKVLLGTATPSVETFFNAKKDKYGLVELTQRHLDIQMPEIIIADVLKDRKEQKNNSIFHHLLIKEIKQVLANKEQVILFQNRRGFSPFVSCKTCGWIPKCERCDVSLTYHIDSNELKCHYCGFRRNIVSKCDACGDIHIETQGFGTQKVEDEIRIFFPSAKVARLDLDVAKRKDGYERMITSFSSGEIDILVGTQMITKGLDFDNVSLVGVLNADNLLFFPDFRSFERSFQLITQVSGRAGRKNKRGKVIVQTSVADHKILKYIIENDFVKFYNEEIEERKMFHYPPFFKLIKIQIKHKEEPVALNFSKNFAIILQKSFHHRVLGPTNPLIHKIQNYYIQEILIKFEDNINLLNAKNIILKNAEFLKSQKNYSGIFITYNVDAI